MLITSIMSSGVREMFYITNAGNLVCLVNYYAKLILSFFVFTVIIACRPTQPATTRDCGESLLPVQVHRGPQVPALGLEDSPKL